MYSFEFFFNRWYVPPIHSNKLVTFSDAVLDIVAEHQIAWASSAVSDSVTTLNVDLWLFITETEKSSVFLVITKTSWTYEMNITI